MLPASEKKEQQLSRFITLVVQLRISKMFLSKQFNILDVVSRLPVKNCFRFGEKEKHFLTTNEQRKQEEKC